MNIRITALALLGITFCTALAAPAAEPPPESLTKKITAAIRAHAPETQFEIVDDKFTAKHQTMTFTLHTRGKTGEISTNTYQTEGPNHRGFILMLSQEEGPYQGAAAIPQTLEGPYFPTFIDAAATADGRGHLRVGFSYGRHLDEKLKQAVFTALSETGCLSLPAKKNDASRN